MGYTDIERTQKTRDRGIDILLHHSIPLSDDDEYLIGVQCKKEKAASRKKPSEITNFIGALTQHKCREGFWITTAPESKFDDDIFRNISRPITLLAKSQIVDLLNEYKLRDVLRSECYSSHQGDFSFQHSAVISIFGEQFAKTNFIFVREYCLAKK
ncbi:MAG: restriction endonuclease [Deltaproteobacteria bacterium]|nr:restriction endonuclease [Deltaproteobacteria bacterium]